jgi:ribosomal protein S24E
MSQITGYIYSLSAPTCPSVYIGSTINPKRRFTQHLLNPTKASKIVMGYTGAKMTILESLIYDDVSELKKREKHHITANNNSCNIQHPTRTSKEYYQDNIIKIKDHQNSVITCDKCAKTYTIRNKARHYKKYCKPDNKASNILMMLLLIYFNI